MEDGINAAKYREILDKNLIARSLSERKTMTPSIMPMLPINWLQKWNYVCRLVMWWGVRAKLCGKVWPWKACEGGG